MNIGIVISDECLSIPQKSILDKLFVFLSFQKFDIVTLDGPKYIVNRVSLLCRKNFTIHKTIPVYEMKSLRMCRSFGEEIDVLFAFPSDELDTSNRCWHCIYSSALSLKPVFVSIEIPNFTPANIARFPRNGGSFEVDLAKEFPDFIRRLENFIPPWYLISVRLFSHQESLF